MAKLDNNQNTEKLTTRDKAQINLLANTLGSQLISFLGKNFGSLNSNFSNLNQEISNVSENISSISNASYSHIINNLNKSLSISKSFIKKHIDQITANNLLELEERRKFLEESGEDNTKELKATNKEIIKITNKLANSLRGQQAKAFADEKKAKEEAQIEQDRQYKEQRLSKRPENLQKQIMGEEKSRWDFSKLTAKDRISMVSDLKSGAAPEKVLAQVKSLQKTNLEKRMAAFDAESTYYKRENSFYEDLAEVQKDLLKFQDKREQYFEYAEKVVGKLHEQEISVQDRKRLAYDKERKNYIKALELSKLQQQIEDTRAKTWFLEGGLTKNMIAYRADSVKYIQTVKENFVNKILQPFRTMKKWWSNTKSMFSFGKDLIGSFFGRKPTGTQKQPEQVRAKAEVVKDDTEEIKDKQETEEYHDDIRSKFDKLLDFFLETKTTSKEKRSALVQTGEGSGGSDWLNWLAIASNFMPGKKLLKGVWGLGKFGVKGIGATLKGTGKFAVNPISTTKTIGKSIAAVPGVIKTFATKKATNIGKSVIAKSETSQAAVKGFNFIKDKAAKAVGSFKTKGIFGTAKSIFTGVVMNMIPKGLMNQFKSLFSKFAKPITKLIAKFGGIAGLKIGLKGLATAGKGIPALGVILGVIFAIHRAFKGDWWGALLELASGLAGGLLPPGIGMGLSMAIEMGLQYKDFKNAKLEESPALAAAKAPDISKENLTKDGKEVLALEKQHTSQSNGKFQVKGLNANVKNLSAMAGPNYQITSNKVNDKIAQTISDKIDQISSKTTNSNWVETKFLQGTDLNASNEETKAKSVISNEIKKIKPNSEKLKKSEKAVFYKLPDGPMPDISEENLTKDEKEVLDLEKQSQEKLLAIYKAEAAKSVVSKTKPLPKIEHAPVNNNTQQNNNNNIDNAKVVDILNRIDNKMGNVAENTANPKVTSVPVPMETSVADYSGGANAQMQGI